jgi:hypothetical protein
MGQGYRRYPAKLSTLDSSRQRIGSSAPILVLPLYKPSLDAVSRAHRIPVSSPSLVYVGIWVQHRRVVGALTPLSPLGTQALAVLMIVP